MQALRRGLAISLDAERKKKSYLKRLGVFHWRIGKNQRNKNPHALRLQHTMTMKAVSLPPLTPLQQGQHHRINEIRRNSGKPFGTLDSYGRFTLNKDLVPFYNIPDLTGFELKPYVSPDVQKVDKALLERKAIGGASAGGSSGGGWSDPLSRLR